VRRKIKVRPISQIGDLGRVEAETGMTGDGFGFTRVLKGGNDYHRFERLKSEKRDLERRRKYPD